MGRIYVCIDLKSFYASVECVERGLDPIKTNLVVADESRTDKTICLAVSPSLKKIGLPGRARLYEVKKRVKSVNVSRRKKINYKRFNGSSYNLSDLNKNLFLKFDFIAAVPRMRLYMKYSAQIYGVYLKYLSSDDIYVYSIDEVFCDITNYLNYYNLSPKELVTNIILDVYKTTGITATAGIGTNLYLAKVAMDILAKHTLPNKDGVRIAFLDEMEYRKKLWDHKPLTDFWRVGKGYVKRLESNGIYTMGDIAEYSIYNEDLLYKLFGVNAEILIDHAWGYEPCMIKDIKCYKPSSNSLSSGQVLHEAYSYDKAKIIVKEMVDSLAFSMVSKKYVSDTFVLDVGYDISNLTDLNIRRKYFGEITKDYYGRLVPKPMHGTVRLRRKSSSSKMITKSILELFDEKVNRNLLIRRINISACDLTDEELIKDERIYKQFNLFLDNSKFDREMTKELEDEKKDRNIQRMIINIKNKYGKNSVLKGMNLEEGATMMERNNQIGGHRE